MKLRITGGANFDASDYYYWRINIETGEIESPQIKKDDSFLFLKRKSQTHLLDQILTHFSGQLNNNFPILCRKR